MMWLLTATIASPAAAQGAKVEEKFGDWSLHVAESETGRICFAAASPKETKPANTTRTTTLFYISAWPKDGVKSEISVKLGFTTKASSKVAVTVGKDLFKLTPSEERAYVTDTGQELKLVEALKKAQAMTVESVPAKGPIVTDTYALPGLVQALQAMAKACP